MTSISRFAPPFTPLLLSAALLAGCAGSGSQTPWSSTNRWDAPPIDWDTRVVEVESGAELSFDEMISRLTEADVIFVGENHDDETTHRVEAEVYRRLLDATGDEVVLAMEMFERDVQPTLDAYLRGDIDETEFRTNARPWRNYPTSYRPMIELAKARGLPVVAANFPAPVRRKLSASGDPTELSEEERAFVPQGMNPPTDVYWNRVMNAVRGHRQMMGGAGGSNLYSGQNLWDNSMAESCSLAIDANPGWKVVHVNGGFHSQYWEGTVHQLRLRRPDLKIATVAVSPQVNPRIAQPSKPPIADFVCFATDRATDGFNGSYQVTIPSSLSYRLHVPKSANPDATVPLLVWLGDDGLRSSDALSRWAHLFGDRVAIAVLDPLHRSQQDDLSLAGRWSWPDTLSEDIGSATRGIAETWGFLLRNYPIDPQNVVIAGEGTGATMVAAAAIFGPSLDADVIAIAPRRYSSLRDFPLPLGDVPNDANRLAVLVADGDREWWDEEGEEYRSIGRAVEISNRASDPWARRDEAPAKIAQALGVSLNLPSPTGRSHIVLPSASPLALHWGNLIADRRRAEGYAVALFGPRDGMPDGSSSTPIDVAVHPRDFASGEALPLAPGPFGGTTVIVVPDDASASDRQEWIDLEANEVLQKRSRFHRLRVATVGGERDLTGVLRKLLDEGRRNVLILPARFAAGGDEMRQIEARTVAVADDMSLQFLPGLGGQLSSRAATP